MSNYQLSINNYQLPEGYKQTEVGVIPEDWDVDELANLTQSKRPISYGIVQTGRSVQGGVACIRVVDINDGTIDDKDLITTSEEISNSYKRTILGEGDLIIALRGKIGELAVVPKNLEGANLTRGVALIVLQGGYSSQFYQQYLSSTESKIRLQNSLNGSALQELPIATVRSFFVAVPPLSEQRAIAQALSDVDALITALDKLIAKQRHLKTATMQQLLTGKKRLPGFGGAINNGQLIIDNDGNSVASEDNCQLSINNYQLPKGYKQTEVGVIPEDWDLRSIGDIGSVSSGGTPSRTNLKYWNGSIPWVTTTQIDFNIIIDAEQFITFDGLKYSAAKLFPPGTLLMAMYGQGKTRGKVAILGVEASTNQACAAITLGRDVNQSYVFHYLVFQYEAIRNLSNTGNQENLNGLIIKSIQIPLPHVEEQRAIATVLSDMDEAISALEARRAKTQAIKQGMMQQLLTGKVRLLDKGIDN